MGLCPDTGAAEMSHVSPGLDDARTSPVGVEAYPVPVLSASKAENLKKYFAQRYRLFHRFDKGIKLDEESWYSVTPEKIAAHIAQRFGGRELIVDLFCGAGGNSIQFALNGAFVIAVDICPNRVALARNNARVYGVDQYIEFVISDVYQILPALLRQRGIISAVFMSPPWGGPGYLEVDNFDVSVFSNLVALARSVSQDMAILLPRNLQLENVLQHFGPCEVERNYLRGKLKTITVYFGSLIETKAAEQLP